MARLTRESVVVAIRKLVIDEDGMSAVLVLEALPHAVDLVLRDLEAGPAIPLEAGGLAQAAQASDKATRRHGKAVAAILGALDGDGQAVGEEQQAARDGLVAFVDGAGHVGNVWRSAVVRLGVSESRQIPGSVGGSKDDGLKKGGSLVST